MKRQSVFSMGAIILSSLLLVACSGDSPQALVKSYYQQALAGHTEQVAKMLDEQTSPQGSFLQQHLDEVIQQFKTRADQQGGLKEVAIKKVNKVDDDHLEVYVALVMGNGNKHDEGVAVVRRTIDNHKVWRIKIN